MGQNVLSIRHCNRNENCIPERRNNREIIVGFGIRIVGRLLEAGIGELEGSDVESPVGEVRVVGTEGVEEAGRLFDAILGELAVVEGQGLDVVLADVLAEVAEGVEAADECYYFVHCFLSL